MPNTRRDILKNVRQAFGRQARTTTTIEINYESISEWFLRSHSEEALRCIKVQSSELEKQFERCRRRSGRLAERSGEDLWAKCLLCGVRKNRKIYDCTAAKCITLSAWVYDAQQRWAEIIFGEIEICSFRVRSSVCLNDLNEQSEKS